MDMLNNMLSADTIRNAQNDVYKFGVAYVVAQLLSMKQLDKEWAMSTLLTLVGFVAYHVLTAKLVDSGKLASGSLKNALDDVLKFGTMLVASRLLAGGSVTDMAWLKETAYYLAGFVAYNLATSKLYDTAQLSRGVGAAVDDALKFGTAFATLRLLNGQPMDREWLMSSGAFIAGLAVWNLVLMT